MIRLVRERDATPRTRPAWSAEMAQTHLDHLVIDDTIAARTRLADVCTATMDAVKKWRTAWHPDGRERAAVDALYVAAADARRILWGR